mgnify:CR=1 FL=1
MTELFPMFGPRWGERQQALPRGCMYDGHSQIDFDWMETKMVEGKCWDCSTALKKPVIKPEPWLEVLALARRGDGLCSRCRRNHKARQRREAKKNKA